MEYGHGIQENNLKEKIWLLKSQVLNARKKK